MCGTQDALGQQLYDAANNNQLETVRKLIGTPGININWVNAVSAMRCVVLCCVMLSDPGLTFVVDASVRSEQGDSAASGLVQGS
jgi:hypothetical protein